MNDPYEPEVAARRGAHDQPLPETRGNLVDLNVQLRIGPREALPHDRRMVAVGTRA